MAPVPEEWLSQHDICLGIERISFQLQKARNLVFTYLQSILIAGLLLNTAEVGKIDWLTLQL